VKKAAERLAGKFIDKINFRSASEKWMTDEMRRENVRRSKIRVRVEHVFGFMVNTMKGKMVRCIGMARAEGKIGLMNLTYNLCRYVQINKQCAAPVE
jgi:IS5 family transposase